MVVKNKKVQEVKIDNICKPTCEMFEVGSKNTPSQPSWLLLMYIFQGLVDMVTSKNGYGGLE